MIFVLGNCTYKNALKVLFNLLSVAIFSWILMWWFTINGMLKEIAMMAKNQKKYLTQFESYIRLFTYLSFPLISFYFNPMNWEQKGVAKVLRWQYHVNGVGLFCTWVIQLFIMGRIPRFGICIEVKAELLFKFSRGHLQDIMAAF